MLYRDYTDYTEGLIAGGYLQDLPIVENLLCHLRNRW